MKLYNLDHSPYSTRVRIQVARGGLPVEVQPLPVPIRTPEFVARFPLGKIPVLELDDGSHLADSWVIMEYLESIFPDSALIPGDPLARARMQSLARCADTCFGPGAVFAMFRSIQGQGAPDALLDDLDAELARLDRLLPSLGETGDRALHLGDIALAPHMAYALMLAPMFGGDDPLAAHGEVSRWWRWVREDATVAAELEVMESAARSFFSG